MMGIKKIRIQGHYLEVKTHKSHISMIISDFIPEPINKIFLEELGGFMNVFTDKGTYYMNIDEMADMVDNETKEEATYDTPLFRLMIKGSAL